MEHFPLACSSLYRATGDDKYREAGWKIFQAFEEHCRLPSGGYVGIEDVRDVPPRLLDGMETFWIGETLSKCSLNILGCGEVVC